MALNQDEVLLLAPGQVTMDEATLGDATTAQVLALAVQAQDTYFKWITEKIVIENDEQLAYMSDMDGVGKKLLSKVDGARLGEKRPKLDECAAIDAKYKPLINRLQFGIDNVATAIITYTRAKKAAIEAALKKQADDQRAREAEVIKERQGQIQENTAILQEAEVTGEVAELKPLTPMPGPEPLAAKPVAGPIRGHLATTSVIEEVTMIVEDANLVPRDCCSPDLKKCMKKYAFDHLPIPGILISPKAHTQTRMGGRR